ncbi:MAG: hypothetical protein ACJ75J_15000, partial [Cytophagaceae bacterium]
MSTSLTIPKDPVYPPSMDWQFLRREGIRQIEKLGSDIWTDYNLHDPGITILEILSYAITDLGYRCNMPPADLFSGGKGTSFFTASRVLACGPVTALDLRKLLVDIPGIKNAWVEQMEDGEVTFWFGNMFSNTRFFREVENYLQILDLTPDELNLDFAVPDSALIAAIYKCQSDKDKDKARDDFRQDMITRINAANLSDNFRKIFILYMADRSLSECLYYILEDLGDDDELTELQRTDYELIVEELRLLHNMLQVDDFNYNWDKKLDIIRPGSTLLGLVKLYPEIANFLCEQPLLALLMAGSLRITAMPGDNVIPGWYNIFVPQGIYTVTLMLEPDADEESVVAEARSLLQKVRNLDEDYDPHIRVVESIAMGVDLCLEIDPAADALEVMCKVHQVIEHYLRPPIVFYSLEEMLNRYGEFLIDAEVLQSLRDARLPEEVVVVVEMLEDKHFVGSQDFRTALANLLPAEVMEDYYDDIFINVKKIYDADQVYKGPILKNGFVIEEELVTAQPRQTVYRSDIYQAITGVEGVIDIERLEIYRCDKPDLRTGNWCLQFECRCLPQLSWDCSYFSIVSNGIELPVNEQKIIEYIEAHPEPVSKLNREGLSDLPVPIGKPLHGLSSFTSIQMDFPRTYKIGVTGISKKESVLRQAQVKQLQGYLFFYDQLLANYLSHLSSVKDILSVTPGASKKFQPLYDIPGVRDLLLDFDPAASWADFTADENNAYVTVLKRLADGNDTRAKLYREKVLDHLLARFGEQFTDFALQLYKIEKPLNSASAWEPEEKLDDIIADKERFLQHVAELGYFRASAFNYYSTPETPSGYWNTGNVEGVKKRVCAILGMKDATRHTITCPPLFTVEVAAVRSTGGAAGKEKYEYYVRSDDKKTRLLVSTARFSSQEAAIAASREFLNMSVDKSSYGIVNGNRIAFWAGIDPTDRTNDNALLVEPVENADQVEKRLKHIQDLSAGNCEDDGFHIIEHILLRPRNDSFAAILEPMLACLREPEMLDPYSFWMTIVVPGWTGRFSDPKRLEVFMQ